MPETADPVLAPDYYRKYAFQPVEVTEAYDLNARLAQCVQYILRHKDKGDPLGDLKKARNWLSREIAAQETGKPQWEDELARTPVPEAMTEKAPRYDIYLSGPMTGLPNHGFDAFNAAARKLRAQGYTVFNPAETDGGDAASSREYYMRIDIAAILASDLVLLLPGWDYCPDQEAIDHFRRGTLTELLCAVECGISVMEYDENRLTLMRPLPKERYQYLHVTLEDAQTITAGWHLLMQQAGKEACCETGDVTPLQAQNETILQEAQRLVHGDRNAAYGHPVDDMDRSGAMVTAILGEMLKPGCEVKAEQMCLIMQAVKISRETNRPKRDNRTDGAGYWECLDMVHEERERRARKGK